MHMQLNAWHNWQLKESLQSHCMMKQIKSMLSSHRLTFTNFPNQTRSGPGLSRTSASSKLGSGLTLKKIHQLLVIDEDPCHWLSLSVWITIIRPVCICKLRPRLKPQELKPNWCNWHSWLADNRHNWGIKMLACFYEISHRQQEARIAMWPGDASWHDMCSHILGICKHRYTCQ